MLRTAIFSVITIFLTASCQKKSLDQNYQISKFRNNNIQYKTLKSEKFVYNQIQVPHSITKVNSKIVVTELAGDTLISVINAEDMTFDHKFGKEGQGPGEFYKIWNLYPASEENEFWIYCPETKISTLYDLNEGKITKTYKQTSDDVLAVQFAPTYRNSFVGIKADGSYQFAEFSTMGREIAGFNTWDGYVEKSEDIPKNVIASVHQGKLYSNPSQDKFALACINRDMIEVLDLKDSSILSIRGPENIIPEFTVDYSAGYPMALTDRETDVYCYFDAFLSENYIYGLYSGETSINVNQFHSDIAKIIYKFSYKGKLIASYKLDTSIQNIHIDEKESKIYGVTTDKNPGIAVFSM
ncbi:BF3164 family lipoprotein [uncultured Marivirga sp.]|uniref:BF3164 family lipoprotein n=1 Tax=uncultured Marivirga sp. TaxID=1123707 RepID=UPI0030ECFB00|tara:strand:- start:459038 stop:460099 length:1062 start_codon:yes stop_codon:yes gene_type:complete